MTRDISESSSSIRNHQSDIESQIKPLHHQHQKHLQHYRSDSPLDTQTVSSRDNKDLLGVNIYSMSPPSSSGSVASSSISTLNTPSGGNTGSTPNYPVSITDSSTNASTTQSTITLSQADDSLSYTRQHEVDNYSSTKNNFPKPFPLKPGSKKGEVIQEINHPGEGGVSDNNSDNKGVLNVGENIGMQYKGLNTHQSNASEENETSSVGSVTANIVSRKIDETTIAAYGDGNTSSQKVVKSDKKQLSEKVRNLCFNP